MKKWALLVAGLYGLILAVLTVPAGILAFSDTTLPNAVMVYREWTYWLWLAVMVLSQVALLAAPVRLALRRPVSRGSLVPTVLAGGLMMGLLAAGAVFALYEFAFQTEGDDVPIRMIGGLAALTWALWSVVFMRWGRTGEPENFVSRQCRALFKGSILELLIAVPTHIVARHRDYCCAGIMTFIGLVAGTSVMLFSFGPAVFFLFAARWRRLHPAAP